MNKRIYDKFDKTVEQLVIYAKAASIDAKVDCIYPESFAIGLLSIGNNYVSGVLSASGVNLSAVSKEIKELLRKKIRNNKGMSGSSYTNLEISKQVLDICRMADSMSIDMEDKEINIIHIFLAMLTVSKVIANIFIAHGLDYDTAKEQLLACDRNDVANKDNNEEEKDVEEAVEGKSANSCRGKQNRRSALKTFCVDITNLAKANELDPIIAREKEIEQAITILCRRNKNNPVLLGEPGVGKTAVVEGIAQRIVSGTVPKQLLNFKVYSLNIGGMVAGTKYRGDFEERINALVKEIEESPNVILFIDEIHTIIGAGGASGGSLDASNILKPFLTKNKLKCIGATTLMEYKKYFKKDGALERRFQQVMIEEPTVEQMFQILGGIKDKLEGYHKCKISDGAISSVINLTARYMSNRNFPDKAIDCLDIACAKYAWDNSKIDKTITQKDINLIVSELCKIPLEIISCNKGERVDKIESVLKDRVMGQDSAIHLICRALRNAYSGVRNPNKPIGNFVFGGQSGTGKTYVAKELAMSIFGRDTSFVRLDMTEYSEAHSISKLIGSPPGYVGFSETEGFTDRVKKNPYCIILLDEMEKAHPYVIKMFLQVMSDGIMTDATGEIVSFKNAVLIMTGNFGMNSEAKKSLGFTHSNEKTDINKIEQKRMIDYCENAYGAEFVNRIDEFIPFMPLSDDSLKQIALINLDEIKDRIGKIGNISCSIKFTSSVFDFLLKRMTQEHGRNATSLKRMISKEIEPCIASTILTLADGKNYSISIEVKDDQIISSVKE